MTFVVVSSVADKCELVVDDDMSVGEVRGVIQAMLDAADDEELVMVVNGCTLTDDEATWKATMTHCFGGRPTPPKTKIYCRVGARRKVEMDSEAMRFALPSRESKEEELNEERERARQMEPLIEQMSKNPNFVESMLNMQPEMKKLMESNPDIARQLRNPDVLKELMMSQLHPDRRRDLGRSMDLQLAQLSAIPGGQQMLERYTHGMTESLERAQFGAQSTEDLHETPEDMARPKPGQTSNADALPNPWQAPPPQSVPTTTLPSGFGQSPFGLFPPTQANTVSGAPAYPRMSPALFQQLMAASAVPGSLAATQPGGGTPSTSPAEPDYSAQLNILRDMGFADTAVNTRVLKEASGDVELAVQLLADLADAASEDHNTTDDTH